VYLLIPFKVSLFFIVIMDRQKLLRLQRFLTLADTVHDFCDLNRYPRPLLVVIYIDENIALQRSEHNNIKSHKEFMKLFIDDITSSPPQNEFEEFLLRYKTAFNINKIDCFWFVVYKFLFFIK
jgi:hypothetical protein